MEQTANRGWRTGILSVVSLTGVDSASLLQRLSTQDVLKLPVGHSAEAFLTDVKGRTLWHGMVVHGPEQWYLVGAAGLGQAVVDHIDRYIIRDDCELEDQSQRWRWWAGDHRTSLRLSAPLNDGQVICWPSPDAGATTDLPPLVEPLQQVLVAGWDWSDTSGWVIGCQLQIGSLEARPEGAILPTPEGGDSIALPSAAERALLRNVLGPEFDPEQPLDGFERARIGQGWPWFGHDIDRQNLPQEVDRDRRAISFTKGCYLGQETVARLDALGQVQKKLVRLSGPGQPPPPGTPLEAQGRAAGQLCSTISDGASQPGWVGLGYVRRSFWSAGTELRAGEATVRVVG